MAVFYKGVGVGTYLHGTDLRLTGISPRNPGGSASTATLSSHVARGTTTSPYVSLSRSFGVARDYAINASAAAPSAATPAYVYEVHLTPADNVTIEDPVFKIASLYPDPLVLNSYQHDGGQLFLLGVVDPAGMASHLSAHAPQPTILPGGTLRPPNLTIELETMVRALRDSEILVVGTVPSKCVVNRHPEF